jgi:hypothetical protein
VAVAAADEPKHPATPPAGQVHKPATPSGTSPTPKTPKQDAKPALAKNDPPAPKDPPAGKADGGGCDEVSCVLNNYEGACCAKFKKNKGGGGGGGGGAKPAAGGGGGGDLPDSLDRTMISDGVGKVKARVMSCGDKSQAKGQVKVAVKVGPDGHVSSVAVRNTPDPALGDCVAGMMQKAVFAKTQNGGSFAYPYTF